MLALLSEKLEGVFKRLRGQGVLTESNIAEALKEIRLALLEADVNFKIVKDFVERVRAKATDHRLGSGATSQRIDAVAAIDGSADASIAAVIKIVACSQGTKVPSIQM